MLRGHRAVITNLAKLAALPSISREDFFRDLVLRIADVVEIDHVKLLRYRPEHSDLLMEAGVGWKEGMVGSATFAADMSSPTGRAFRTGEPVMVENIAESTGFLFSETLAEHNIVSLVNVPVLIDGSTWGVLEADSCVPRSFSADTEEFMISAAALTGLVIARTKAEAAHQEAIAAMAIESQRRVLLLNEMQHRVKNNFQTIMSMIQLRKSRFPLEKGRSLADEILAGIMAMALAHEQLAPTRTGEIVELGPYLRALIASVAKPHEGIAFELEANDVTVGIDQAVPLGLIVNEAITNAVKHAFPEARGRIRIALRSRGLGQALLCIADNGIGGADKLPQGSGLRLMTGLARQLGGHVERLENAEHGITIMVAFPTRMQKG
jgi:two-component sensor histidine kinase